MPPYEVKNMTAFGTRIDFFEGVKLDKDHKHVLGVFSYTKRNEIFDKIVSKTYDENSFQRRDRNIFRVGCKVKDISKATYMRYLNDSYNDRYFYCFVDQVVYVNDNTTDVYYTVDSYMTYCGDIDFQSCYVEREHIATDTPGVNTLGEPLPIGNYVSISSDDTVAYQLAGDRLKNNLVICTTFDEKGKYKAGQYRDGVYGGTFIRVFPANTKSDASAINKWLENVTNANMMDGIVNMFLVSDVFIIPDTPVVVTENNKAIIEMPFNFGSGQLPCGYTPKNKKLYTYPYNFLECSDGTNSGTYRYELFADSTKAHFLLFCSINNGMPAFSLVPYGYNGGDERPQYNGFPIGSQSANFDERIDMNLYSPVAVNVDSFKAWLAQNMGGAVPIFNAGATIAGGVASGNVLGTVLNLGSQAINFAQQTIQPPTQKGASVGNVMTMTRHLLPFFISKSIDYSHARMIDDFFTMYGYQTNRIKKPNVNSRPHFNYVKCANAIVGGNIPKVDVNIIQDMLNNGCTFWKNLSEIGDYSVSNT